jgi:hypothetical protein
MEYYSAVKNILFAIGSIVAIMGAVRIHYLWSNGKREIDREVVMWMAGILVLYIAATFISLVFEL